MDSVQLCLCNREESAYCKIHFYIDTGLTGPRNEIVLSNDEISKMSEEGIEIEFRREKIEKSLSLMGKGNYRESNHSYKLICEDSERECRVRILSNDDENIIGLEALKSLGLYIHPTQLIKMENEIKKEREEFQRQREEFQRQRKEFQRQRKKLEEDKEKLHKIIDRLTSRKRK